MFEALEAGLGLDIVLSLQAGRNDIFNMLVTLLDFMGYSVFYLAFLSLVYWVFNRKAGMRLYFSLIVISLLVFTFKDLLGRPRPFQAWPDLVTPLFEADGFGVPSGHTAISMVVWGYLAYRVRRLWFVALIVVYITLQAWGRMYAGVHFPQDIVGGLLLGGITLGLYIAYADRIVTLFLSRPLWQQAIVPIIIGIVGLVAYTGNDDGLTIIGLLVGGSLAASFTKSTNFYPHVDLPRRVAQYLIGLLLSIIILFGLDILFGENDPAAILRVIRYTLVALFALFFWPIISLRAGLMLTESSDLLTSESTTS